MAQDPLNIKAVVIGGSAGSLDVVLQLCKKLRQKQNAFYIIVLHRRNDNESILEGLIADKTDIPVKDVEDKEPIKPGTIYIAPPDYHLLLENEKTFSLDSSEKIHFSRPSIDVTFESVAEIFKQNTIGVLLSGANADGTIGLIKIKKAGGYTIVQDPTTADVSFMPQHAIDKQKPDAIVHPSALAQLINSLTVPVL